MGSIHSTCTHVWIISDNGSQASSRAVCVVRLISTVASRTERLRVLLAASNIHHCITRTYLVQPLLMSVGSQRNKCLPQIVIALEYSSHTKTSSKKNSSHGIWSKKYCACNMPWLLYYGLVPRLSSSSSTWEREQFTKHVQLTVLTVELNVHVYLISSIRHCSYYSFCCLFCMITWDWPLRSPTMIC